MGGIAFDGIALRGEIGSKAKHKNLRRMHLDEKEFNDKQELKKKIKRFIVEEANKYIKKEKPMFGKEYFRIEAKDNKAFVEDLVNLVLEQMRNNISIITDSELKQKVEELTRQLLNKGEVMAKNNKLEQSNEELIQENKKLKEINANLNNQDEIIKDRNLQISNLSADLIQKEDEDNKPKNKIKSFEADKEKTNQSLKQRNEELEALLSSENALKEDNDSKRLQIVKLQTSINSKDQRISELEGEVKVKDETIENLQDKLTVLENFKTKVISFISKISNLIPNFSRLLDDEPNEVKNEIKGKMYSRDGMEM